MPRNANKTHCLRGHEFTPENTGFENNSRNGEQHRSRYCKACVSYRKRLRYQSDPLMRARAIHYNRWWRKGHPEGKQWPEIKAELIEAGVCA